MKFNRIIAIFAVIALLTLIVPFDVEGSTTLGAEVTSEITITDSRGVTTTLDKPATHVASFGAFATNTLIDIGNLSNAVIFDENSKYSISGIDEVKNYSDDMFVKVSSANKDMVVQKMLGLYDNSTWNKSTDVILMYGYSYLSTVWTDLESNGFIVITFYPNSYNGIVQAVEDIETIVGADHGASEQMAYVKTYIKSVLDDNGITNDSVKTAALYASYSSGALKLGNNNSVTIDFIIFAGGVNVAEDPTKTTPTYTADFSAILLLQPEFVLLDGYYSGTADEFSALIGDDDITVYKLDKAWNSYCPDAMVGLWTVACLFYPEYFNGEVPTIPVVPDSPTDLSAVASDGYVTLTWTAPANDGGAAIDHYEVYVNGTLGNSTTINSANITGLTNGVSYIFTVAAHNSVGMGANSTPINATPTAALQVPGAPYNVEANEGDGYVTLTWTAPANDGGAAIDHYEVYVNGTLAKTTTSTSANITGLTNGVEYSFTVAAHNSVGMGAVSSVVKSTPTAPSIDDEEDNSTLLYAGVGVGVILVALAAVLIMRRGSK